MDEHGVLADAEAAIGSRDSAKIRDAMARVDELAKHAPAPVLQHTRLRDKKSEMRDSPFQSISDRLRSALAAADEAELERQVRQRVLEVGAPQPAFDYSKEIVIVFESGYSLDFPFSENNYARILTEIGYIISKCGGVAIKEISVCDAE